MATSSCSLLRSPHFRRSCRQQACSLLAAAPARQSSLSRQSSLLLSLRRRTTATRLLSSAVSHHGPYGGSAGFSVPYEVRPSPLGGTGLFSVEPIPKGTLIWSKTCDNCKVYPTAEAVRAHLALLTPEEVQDFLDHAYCDKGEVVDIQDDGRYWNHSKTPNTGSCPFTGESVNTYAVQDIAAEEELLDNYLTYTVLDWYERICQEHGAESLFEVGAKFD